MRSTCAYEEATRWEALFQKSLTGKPVTIRVAVSSTALNKRTPTVHYLVTSCFFKLLNELTVLDYRHQYGSEGLSFYLDVLESRSAVKAYLQNLKNFHVLGVAWDLAILDGINSITQIRDSLNREPLKGYELEAVARMHMGMGSRPLRFSRYFLYAALAPFGRDRCYGSCCMSYEDAKGDRNFFKVLQGLEILVRSFSSLDFSSINSLNELRTRGVPIEEALNQLAGRKGLLKGLLFHSLLLAVVYEQKAPMDQIPERIQSLVKGIEKDFQRSVDSESLALFHRYGLGGARLLAMTGFQPLIDQALPYWQRSRDLDDLSLFLLAKTFDTTTLADLALEDYNLFQRKAESLLDRPDADRDGLNREFYQRNVVTDGISDLISIVLLLDLLQTED